MKLSESYPSLAVFCEENGSPLDSLTATLNSTDEMHNLMTCCEWVRQGCFKLPNAADPYAYLKTIDKFLELFPTSNRKNLWKKLTQGRATSTEFLDTISELALAIYYSEIGQTVEVEKPFNPSRPKGKDADLFLKLDQLGMWIDVLSIRPDDSNFSDMAFHPTKSESDVIAMLNTRIESKFNSKFKGALEAEELTPPIVAIAICMLKAEEFIPSSISFFANGKVDLGESIWDKCPNLSGYSVFTIRKNGVDDYLRPVRIACAFHPNLRTKEGISGG